ncbi:MAG: hypothetical protein GQ532_07175 [Methylomarinum sp.]|nr:hypothetical protein [Methylomarinum sp.]
MAFSPIEIGPGAISTLTYTIDNSTETTGVSGLTFSNTFPTGMIIANPSRASTDCVNGLLSATAGSNTLSLSDARLGLGLVCTIIVDVTSTTAVTYANTSGTLSTSAGSAGTATGTLTVDGARPGFTMTFSPGSISIGHVSTLIYTIDNTQNGSKADFLTFSNTLPPGLVIHTAPNVINNCTGGLGPSAVTATPNTRAIVLTFGHVAAGATCTISIDVTSQSVGQYENVTGSLSQNGADPTGSASALLEVSTSSFLTTYFSTNPASPGSSVTLNYLINNANRESATDISFTHDLNAILPGLTASSLPANDSCGSGSTVTGSSNITFAGGNLSEGGTCTLSVTVLVPANAAAGSYTSNTSTVNLTLGSATTKPAASVDFIIKKAPVLTKAFINDPISAGQDVTVRYTITNTDPDNEASAIAFTDDVNSNILASMVIKTLPNSNSCGTGSTFTNSTNDGNKFWLQVSNAIIAAGNSCTFDVIQTLPAAMSPGSYTTTTSILSAEVSGSTVYGSAASDTLLVLAAPILTTSFNQESVTPGDNVTLEFTLSYGASALADATDIGFTDDLGSLLTGLASSTALQSDICGSGSSFSGTDTLTLTGATLTPGASCSFSVTVAIPNDATPSTITNVTSTVSATTSSQAVSSATASDTLLISGLTLSQVFVPASAFPGATTTLRYTIANSASALDATALQFTNNLNLALSSLAATSLPSQPCGLSSGITGTTFLTFSGGDLVPGASCTFDVPVLVPAGASPGIYNVPTSDMSATVNGNNTANKGTSSTLTVIDIINNPISLTKAFSSSYVTSGSTVNLTYTLTSNLAATDITFTDDLDSLLTGLASTSGTVSNECGVGSEISGTGLLTFSGGSLAEGASCAFTVTLQVPASPAFTTISSTTSTVTAISAIDNSITLTSDAATAGFNAQLVTLSSNFSGAVPIVGSSTTLNFHITNDNASGSLNLLNFTDDMDSFITGMVATDLPKTDICGVGSTLSGTSLISLTSASLGFGESCDFSVTLSIPSSTSAGIHSNTSNNLFSSGLLITKGASADLTVAPKPTLSSNFSGGVVPVGGNTTLNFKITNNNAFASLNLLSFTDDMDSFITGMVATNLPLSNVCGEGSTLSGTSIINLSNASLGFGESCEFSVTLSVPSSTSADIYSNTSSNLFSSGISIAEAASADLTVVPKVVLSSNFSGGVALVGSITTLNFSITNNNTSGSLNLLSFTDDMDSFITGMVATNLPLSNVCGEGSTLSGTSIINLSNASLGFGESCVFSVTLSVPFNTSAGIHRNTSSNLFSSGLLITEGASADLTVTPNITPIIFMLLNQ